MEDVLFVFCVCKAATKRTKSKVSLQSINFEEDPFSGEMAMEELQTQWVFLFYFFF